jgi:hypothetical protein
MPGSERAAEAQAALALFAFHLCEAKRAPPKGRPWRSIGENRRVLETIIPFFRRFVNC